MFLKISALKSFAILIRKRHSNTGVSSNIQPDGVNILIDFFKEHLSLATFVM